MNKLINALRGVKKPISEMVIVQIGANDGKQSDPVNEVITKYKNVAHLCEPIPEYYQILQKQYNKYPKVNCYNVAISTFDGQSNMTYVPPYKDLPDWTRGLGTLDIKGNFLGEGRAGFQGKQDWSNREIFKIVKEREKNVIVKTKTLDTFLIENNITKIDIFVIDAEGHDFIIFDQLDLEKYKPSVIFMETHFHSDEDNNKIDEKLRLHGYSFTKGWDTIAIKK